MAGCLIHHLKSWAQLSGWALSMEKQEERTAVSVFAAEFGDRDPKRYSEIFDGVMEIVTEVESAVKVRPQQVDKIVKKYTRKIYIHLLRNGWPHEDAKGDADMMVGMALAMSQGRATEAIEIITGAQVDEIEVLGGPRDGERVWVIDKTDLDDNSRKMLDKIQDIAGGEAA